MPLLDHFHPPLSRLRHWESLHSAWANALREQLNEVLPPRYFAEVQVSLGRRFEIDVATFEESAGASRDEETLGSGGSLAIWAPPHPTRTAALPIDPPEVFEVRVFSEEEGPTLVAVVEIVSPSNKDRPAHRRAFAVECGGYLHQGLGVVVVDVVTSRGGNFDAEITELLGVPPGPAGPELFACSYRTRAGRDGLLLECWQEPLSVGSPLPTLPLWIGPDLGLPIDLELAYQSACKTSRIG